MNNFWQTIHTYCEAHTTPLSDILYELERETHLKTLAPQMMSGPLQGRLLNLLVKLARPKVALEIGAFTGYAALCIAEGLAEGAVLHTIEVNKELEYIIRKYLDRSGLSDKVMLHIGKAEQIIPELPARFDWVFIDAGKQNYAMLYDLVIERMNPGGLILADNTLWSGKVATRQNDPDTRILHAFNEKVQNDARVENILLPIRDGLMVARVKNGCEV